MAINESPFACGMLGRFSVCVAVCCVDIVRLLSCALVVSESHQRRGYALGSPVGCGAALFLFSGRFLS